MPNIQRSLLPYAVADLWLYCMCRFPAWAAPIVGVSTEVLAFAALHSRHCRCGVLQLEAPALILNRLMLL